MSIILQGFGLDVDSMSSIVAFGLTLNPQTEEEAVEAIHGADISQLFVVDYGGRKRKPTQAEYRRYRKWARIVETGTMHFRQKKSRKRGQVETEWYVQRLPKFKAAA